MNKMNQVVFYTNFCLAERPRPEPQWHALHFYPIAPCVGSTSRTHLLLVGQGILPSHVKRLQSRLGRIGRALLGDTQTHWSCETKDPCLVINFKISFKGEGIYQARTPWRTARRPWAADLQGEVETRHTLSPRSRRGRGCCHSLLQRQERSREAAAQGRIMHWLRVRPLPRQGVRTVPKGDLLQQNVSE